MAAAKRQGTAPRVVMAAGGTGGHVYPALATAAEVKHLRPEAQLLFLGGDRLESRTVPAAGYRFHRISVHGLAGRGLSGWSRRTRAAGELAAGLPLLQCLGALRGFGAQVVVGTGGYVSGPAILAARVLGIPSLALEANRTPGWTSRAVAKMVAVMAVAWPDQVAFFTRRVRRSARVVVTGLPVRSDLLLMGRTQGAAALGLDPNLRTVLALGGSLGSRRLNQAMLSGLRIMGEGAKLGEVQVLHITGPRHADPAAEQEMRRIAPRYRATAYLEGDYPAALASADLVVSRAGASTIAELTARGLPMILIPWSGAATKEQERNAEPLAMTGAALVIPDAELTGERLAEALGALLWDDQSRARMARASRSLGRPEAAREVAELALELAGTDRRGQRPKPEASGGRSA